MLGEDLLDGDYIRAKLVQEGRYPVVEGHEPVSDLVGGRRAQDPHVYQRHPVSGSCVDYSHAEPGEAGVDAENAH